MPLLAHADGKWLGNIVSCVDRGAGQKNMLGTPIGGMRVTRKNNLSAAERLEYKKHGIKPDDYYTKDETYFSLGADGFNQGNFPGRWIANGTGRPEKCSDLYTVPLAAEIKKPPDPSDNYQKAPSLQSAMILINAWIEYANQTKPMAKWVNGFKVTAGFSLPYCSKSNSLRVAHVVFDDERQSASYNSLNDTSLHSIQCKPDDKSDHFDAIPYGFDKNKSVELPGVRPSFSPEQLRKIKFFMHDFCRDFALRYIIADGKEYVYHRTPLTSCKTNGKTLEIDLSNEKYPSYK
jgi:hypothetical protein